MAKRATLVAIIVLVQAADSAAGRSLGVSENGAGLFANVQVASLVNGRFAVPKNTTELLVEVGCSNRNTMDQEVLPKRKSAFLFSFEPLLDKYATLLARGDFRFNKKVRDLSVPLGHHDPRGIVLPIAIAPQSGSFPINVSRISGCSSLLPISATSEGRWHPQCRQKVETRIVPAITLARVLELLPPLPIHLLKLDVQGLDLDLLKATPLALLGRVESIELEVINSRSPREKGHAPCPVLYEGQPRLDDVVAHMKTIGYQVRRLGDWAGHLRCEGAGLFTRAT